MGKKNENSLISRLQIEQWLSYAYQIVYPELKSTRDMTCIWETLHHEFALKSFIAGTLSPCIADHVLYGLLRGRINNLLSSSCIKYYRIIRWALSMDKFNSLLSSCNQIPFSFKCNNLNLESLEISLNHIQGSSLFKLSSSSTVASSATNKINCKKVQNEKSQISSSLDNKSNKNKDKSKKDSKVTDSKNVNCNENNVAITSIPKDNSDHSGKNGNENENHGENSNLPLICRIDLKIGRIIKVEKHPNADRLFMETVDFGNGNQKTVLSGLIGHVTSEELLNRMALFVCNLVPAKICGIVSEAMLLAAKSKDGSIVEPLLVPNNAIEGDVVTIMNLASIPDPPIAKSSSNTGKKNSKKEIENKLKEEEIPPSMNIWEQCQQSFSIKDGIAFWNSHSLKIVDKDGNFTSTKIDQGVIS